jgi:antibiotic biosynthesis monooxygenase (ABM) superfamily enzyme
MSAPQRLLWFEKTYERLRLPFWVGALVTGAVVYPLLDVLDSVIAHLNPVSQILSPSIVLVFAIPYAQLLPGIFLRLLNGSLLTPTRYQR